MCQYITIVLPDTARIDHVKLLLAQHELGCRAFQNEFVLGQLKPGRQLVSTTAAHCDCDSVIGCDASPAQAAVQAKDFARLKRKGWSETKISNWAASKVRTTDKAPRHDQERRQWLGFFRAALREHTIGVIGLYSHWYAGSLENERLTFKNKVNLKLSEVKPDTLDQLQPGVLYEFVA